MANTFSPLRLLACFALLLCVPTLALPAGPRPVDAAFHLDVVRALDGDLVCTVTIAPGRYLYRDRLLARTDDGKALPLALPPGQPKDDPTFGTTRVYHDRVTATIARAVLPAAGAVRLTYQGCAERGVCYPPVVRRIDLASLAVTDVHGSGAAEQPVLAEKLPEAPRASAGSLAATLAGGLPSMLLAFAGFGLLLAFTPCVFPMVPILSGMLANCGPGLSGRRGLALSAAYVGAMALAYAALGLVAAWSGRNLQLALQTPLAIGLMALVFVALSLSMFGLYDLALPAAVTARLSRATAGRPGSLGGAALMGFGSALIVGPCVTPPLAAALLYVAQTGNVARGAAALFALGLGMGVPLLVFGVFGGKLLPRAGLWLVTVKQLFGVLFLGLAIWMLGRVLPEAAIRALWGALAVGGGLWFGWLHSRGFAMRLAGGVLAFGGSLVLASSIGLFSGVCPAAFCGAGPRGGTEAPEGFSRRVTTPAALDAALVEARATGWPILIDYTADWCVVCQEIDRTVLADPAIHDRLRGVAVIRADISADSPESRALMRRFDVMGPPTMLFVDAKSGREIAHTRSVGALTADRFGHNLDLVETNGSLARQGVRPPLAPAAQPWPR